MNGRLDACRLGRSVSLSFGDRTAGIVTLRFGRRCDLAGLCAGRRRADEPRGQLEPVQGFDVGEGRATYPLLADRDAFAVNDDRNAGMIVSLWLA
jgi:hypothetical protein